ncbi:hypothetical protein JKP88DRAFT_158516 [Tribonema minus]|uniref:DNA-directed RNA polymerase subunit n=1 Tax=Tribonema minus TaxID=303371 RepID=A0A836CB68_9STRA|nr:hypothetical protein JKP88DRAFT_158516 [Tribonema minus]
MLFCPTCGNLLMVEAATRGGQRFACQTCPYVHPLGQGGKVTKALTLQRKEVDDVLGGADAWVNVDKAPVACADCKDPGKGKEAYFFQAQLRSADEPMTVFYKCVDCGFRWNE